MLHTSELRLFISSTFRDLGAEREYLLKKIFPEGRDLCRRRGVALTEIDLRWGLTDEEGALGRVIRTCLEEVDRCRPFFLGIIGDRYGWVPEMHEIMMDPDLLYKYPWIADVASEGRSVTELEIEHGVFNHRFAEGESACFYRKISDGDRDPRLDRLVARIEESGHPVRPFRTPEELGEAVASDLTAMIERAWPEGEEPSPLDRERRSHAAFAASRRRAYIARPSAIREFREWFDKPDTPLVVTGPSGLGKSSLVAFLGELFARSTPDGILIEHYIGAGDATGSAVDVMRHLIEEIADRCAIDADLPTDPDEITASFESWLYLLGNRAAELSQPVLVVVDAVDRVGMRGRDLSWLPVSMPEGVRLLVSTTPGDTADIFAGRSWRQHELAPIEDRRVRESILVRYLGEYHKGIAAAQLQRISSDKNSISPLFLCVVAEELRLHGEHETLDAEIDRYCGLDSLDDLFRIVIERLEIDFGESLVRTFFSLLALTRHGLTETEFLDLLGVSRMEFSRLLFALDYHLIRNEGILDFSHIYLRRGVEHRYLQSDEEIERMRRQIAEYCIGVIDAEEDAEDVEARLARELCHQRAELGNAAELAAVLRRLPVFRSLVDAEHSYELLSWWHRVDREYVMVEEYRRALEEGRASGASPSIVVDYLGRLGSFFTLAARFDAAIPLLELAWRYNRCAFGREDRQTIGSMDYLAEALYHNDRLAEAKELWQEALEVLERTEGIDAPDLCPILDSLMTVAYRQNEPQMMGEYSQRSLAISEEAYGLDNEKSIDRLENLGAFYLVEDDIDRAIETYAKVVEVSERAWGRRHPATAANLVEYAFALSKAERYDEATTILQESTELLEGRLGQHTTLARGLEMLGNVWIWTGRPDLAEESYRKALRIQRALRYDMHTEVLGLQRVIAAALRRQGKLDEAESILRRIIASLQADGIGTDRSDFTEAVRGLIAVLTDAGNVGEVDEWSAMIATDAG